MQQLLVTEQIADVIVLTVSVSYKPVICVFYTVYL